MLLPAGGGRDGGNGELRNEETAATITKWNATIIIIVIITIVTIIVIIIIMIVVIITVMDR